MKKIVIAFSTALCLFSFGIAFADDAATLYKTHCQACHGADGSRAPTNTTLIIKGKSSAEVLTMLEGYKDGSFGGKSKQVMTGVVKRLSDDQLKSVSDHVSKL